MVKSVTIPTEGTGYLFTKLMKPIKPNEKDFKYRHVKYFDKELYQKDLDIYNQQLKLYNERTTNYKVPCAKNLIGKTFTFEQNKINLLFGENASGKTTILKMIAGEALITDGFTSMLRPSSMYEDNEFISIKKDALKQNSAIVDWDGTPIYYHNFNHTENGGSYQIGGMCDNAILGTLGDEILYRWNKTRTSLGQQSMFFINKLINIANSQITLKSILDPYIETAKSYNDTWQKCYNIQYNYFKQYPMFDKQAPITMLFDEIDKSLDIEKTWLLFNNVLPEMVKQYGVQIIIISHNPLVLTNTIYDNPIYNIISINENYTNNMKQLLKGINY